MCLFSRGLSLAVSLLAFDAVSDPLPSLSGRQPVAVKDVAIRGGFWGERLSVYQERTVPHSWNYMGWELRALEKANGRTVTGDLNGTWGEANLHKFLETVGLALAQRRDPALEGRIEGVIALLAGAQQPDGYLHAFVSNSGKLPWDPDFLDGSHDGYVLGHMIQAALAWEEATGKTNFLGIACRAADQAYEHFLGPHGKPGFCGHAGLEMALVELYQRVPRKQYLDLAQAFIEWRGRHQVKPSGDTPRAYFQDGAPLREQKTLEGHAVRAIFFATGVADVALATGDIDFRLAANRFWQSTAWRRMTIVGGAGPRKEHEAFGEDYELPNEGYYESCVACGLADFAQRMFLLEGKAEAADVLERVLYNAVLHGISLDGTNTYYMNPLSDKDNTRYNSWVCCPPNLSRTLFKVGRYAFATDPRSVFINLYVQSTCEAQIGDNRVRLRVETGLPWNGKAKIIYASNTPRKFALNLRKPYWSERTTLKLNATPVSPLPLNDSGYFCLDREWQPEDTVELEFDMSIRRIEAHPNIADCAGRVALQRGPLIYGFESLDNQGSADLILSTSGSLVPEVRPELLGGITVIKAAGTGAQTLTAIPFYTLANRAKASQEVWVRQEAFSASTNWWLGELYRPYQQ